MFENLGLTMIKALIVFSGFIFLILNVYLEFSLHQVMTMIIFLKYIRLMKLGTFKTERLIQENIFKIFSPFSMNECGGLTCPP